MTRTPPPRLATRGLSRDYGPVRVVDDVSLQFHAGTIHALLGENGAGKSTVVKMLSGVIQPTEGEVLLDGSPLELSNVREGQASGIVALPQELTLVPTLSVAENIFLGMKRPGRRVLHQPSVLSRDARAQLDRLGQKLPMGVPVRELSAVQQTMVALARALVRDARVLILDEPTASLTDSETEQLFAVLRSLREQGTTIIYVSHRLEEVFALADEATVMRNGRHVWTRPIAELDQDQVISAMIGRAQGQLFPDRATGGGDPVLHADGVAGYTVDDVSLTLRRGRVLGIAGLAGSGRSELLRILSGAERAQRGRVLLGDDDLTGRSIAARMSAGVVLVPEERRSQGLVMTHSIASNIALGNYPSLSRVGVASPSREAATASRLVDDLQIRARSIRQRVIELSGGNQQKVVLARYLERRPSVLLLDEPTRGIDVGTKAEIYHLIRRLADEGVAVAVVSSEIPELLGVADEIAVLHDGRLTGVVDAATATEESITHLCYRKSDR